MQHLVVEVVVVVVVAAVVAAAVGDGDGDGGRWGVVVLGRACGLVLAVAVSHLPVPSEDRCPGDGGGA